MKLQALAAGVVLCFACQVVHADLVDMSSVSWTAGNLSGSATSPGGVGVNFSFSGTLTTANHLGTATPRVVSNVSTLDDVLLWRFADAETNGGAGVTQSDVITLTLDFDVPVTDLSFTLADIDTGSNTGPFQNWQDVVIVNGLLTPGAPQPATTMLFGADPAVIRDTGGNIYETNSNTVGLSGRRGDVPETSDEANVKLTYAGPVNQVTIAYHPGLPDNGIADGILGFGPADTTSQFVGLHDLSFTAIPEPSSFVFLGLVSGCTIFVRRREQLLGLFGSNEV